MTVKVFEDGEVEALETGRSIAEWTERGRRSIVNEQAARYKHLGDVVVMEAIPKSPSGKILRRELRDR